MARFILSVDEALEFAQRQRPFPSELESISSNDDTLVVRLNPRDRLPKFLQRLSPVITVHLSFEGFSGGVAKFRVHTALNTLPLNMLTQLLLKIVSLPEMKGVSLQVEDDDIFALVALQSLVNEQVSGITVTDFTLNKNRFAADFELGDIKPVA